MSIARIQIDHYRSIKHCFLDFSDINLLTGENGTGKSNILDAIRHFYDGLLAENDDPSCYHFQNHFCNEFSISITFDFRHLKKISGRNQFRETEPDYDGYYRWISRRLPFETLTMRQIKGKPVRWNQDRRYRQNIRNLFPLYAVDARKEDLADWSRLWEIIGDLMKVHRSREAEIAAEITAIKNREKYKLEERFKKLLAAFSRANIHIKPYTPKQYASALSVLLFRGERFTFQNSRLDYMSDGTNAFNYTNLLIEILKLIFEYKIKDPIIVLDEPEVSLHHKLIDQLTSRILSSRGEIRFLIATHSPRLLKNILKQERSNCKAIHVSQGNGHTQAAEIRLFSQDADNRPRIFMTDQHANAYFSRCILSVEGASENEVFSNAFLQELFPFLREVDVMEGMSDDVVQKIISPKQRHFQTRFLLLADMDQVLVRNQEDNCFRLKGKFLSESELPQARYDYPPARTEQMHRLKRIRGLAKKGRFRYWLPFFSCRDPNFSTLIRLIQEYLLQSGLYVASTTIEGMLITKENLPFFWSYCYQAELFPQTMPALQRTLDALHWNDGLNFVRLLFSGKCDFILNLGEICAKNPGMDPELRRLLYKNVQGKTSGWISGWLDWYFCLTAEDCAVPCENIWQFSRALEDPKVRRSVRDAFAGEFPELFAVLELLRAQLRSS